VKGCKPHPTLPGREGNLKKITIKSPLPGEIIHGCLFLMAFMRATPFRGGL